MDVPAPSPSPRTVADPEADALIELRQRLVFGRLAPGVLYEVEDLARDLGLTAEAVASAVLRLQTQGLIEAEPGGGWAVVELDAKERREVLGVRLLLEVPPLVKLAGSAVFLAALPRLRAQAAAMLGDAAPRDMVAFLELDRAFHLDILRLVDNPQLVRAVAVLRDRARLFGPEATIRASAREHVGILDAMAAGDGAETERLMTAHLNHVLTDWSR